MTSLICPGFPFFPVQDDIYEILTHRHMYQINSYSRDTIETDLHSEGNPKLPPIGTRVRRAPNWPYNGQDSNTCGTVVGHNHRGEYLALIAVNKIILILVFKELLMILCKCGNNKIQEGHNL